MPFITEQNSSDLAQKPATAKILMLHGQSQTPDSCSALLTGTPGHAESGPCFHYKTRRLENYLHETFPAAPSPNHHPEFPGGVQLFYPTGPLRLTPADVTRGCGPVDLSSRRGEVGVLSEKQDLDAWAWGTGDFRLPDEIHGLNQSVAYTLEYMQKYGPFVGVIGFSCGATLSAILASLLEGNRKVEGFSFPEYVSIPQQMLFSS